METQQRNDGWSRCDVSWADRQRVVAMYMDEKLSTLAIAERLGVTPRTVQEWLLKSGVRVRPSLRPRKFGDDAIQLAGRMKKDRYTFRDIAERLGCSHSTAVTLVRRARVEGELS